MSSCTSCGHQLGVGRFCTNCGAPVDSSTPDGTPVSTPVTPAPSDDDWRTDTAERRLSQAAADPRTPPAAVAPPPPPRYPLFADEVEGYTPYGPLTTTTSEPAAEPEAADADASEPAEPAEPEYEPYDYDYDYDEERRSPVLWIVAAALVLVLVTAGWWFLVRDDGSDPAADDGGTGQSAQEPGTSGEDVDVAGRASAKAPKTATPNEDVNGDQVSYDASNMLDGVADTAWRAPGDGTGMKLTFTLREPTDCTRSGWSTATPRPRPTARAAPSTGTSATAGSRPSPGSSTTGARSVSSSPRPARCSWSTSPTSSPGRWCSGSRRRLPRARATPPATTPRSARCRSWATR